MRILFYFGLAILALNSFTLQAKYAPKTVSEFITHIATPAARCTPNPDALTANTNPANGYRLSGVLETYYPETLNNKSAIETLAITPANMSSLTAYLACTASWSGDVFIVDTAATLFGSKRHGARAFASLRNLAQNRKTTATERRMAQDFTQQMQAALKSNQ
jgi:hypothetical protein